MDLNWIYNWWHGAHLLAMENEPWIEDVVVYWESGSLPFFILVYQIPIPPYLVTGLFPGPALYPPSRFKHKIQRPTVVGWSSPSSWFGEGVMPVLDGMVESVGFRWWNRRMMEDVVVFQNCLQSSGFSLTKIWWCHTPLFKAFAKVREGSLLKNLQGWFCWWLFTVCYEKNHYLAGKKDGTISQASKLSKSKQCFCSLKPLGLGKDLCSSWLSSCYLPSWDTTPSHKSKLAKEEQGTIAGKHT